MSRSGSSATSGDPSPAADHLRRQDDDALIEACLREDAAAWGELVGRYEALVFSVSRRSGLEASAADDVFQEVFAILLRRLGGIRNRSGLPKWLITTTLRVCAQWRRREHREAGPSVETSVTAVPSEELSRWEERQRVRVALRRVGGRCEALLSLLYLGPAEPSYEQVAEQLGMPLGSIGPTRARCLRKMLEQLGVPGDE